MVAPPHLLPICQVVKHVSGLLRSPDPQVTIGDLTHQSVTNTPLKIQVDFNQRLVIQDARTIVDDEAALPRHVNCISTRTIIRRVLIIQCHNQLLLFVFSHVCEISVYMVNSCNQEAGTSAYIYKTLWRGNTQ